MNRYFITAIGTDSGKTVVSAIFTEALTAAIVSRWIRRKQNQHIDVESNRVAANLHIAFLEDVKQTNLHKFVEFRQLVDRKDAAFVGSSRNEVLLRPTY